MSKSLKDYEQKRYSQHGEDGIIKALLASLKRSNQTFVEIGATWVECNSRALIEDGWSGEVIDRGNVSEFISHNVKSRCEWVLPRTIKVGNLEPDFFSLDIDSYDYFVADALLRQGFRPKVVCVETNTFIHGANTVTYQDNFSRYEMQPGIGLYFGCGLNAWRHLWSEYGYRYVGMESSHTNAFFVRNDASDWPAADGIGEYQTYFCNKYKMTGEQLAATLEHMPFLDVTTKSYEDAFQRAIAPRSGIVLATTYTRNGWDQHARKFVESFTKHWPSAVKLLCFEEPLLDAIDPDALNVFDLDMDANAPECRKFKERCKDPRTHGVFDDTYHYTFDAVRWSHRIFALAAAARRCWDAKILINIDSDIVTFADVTEGWIMDLLGDADIAYMPRAGMYSECSFVIYRLENPLVAEFIAKQEKFYTTGSVFQFKDGWTDCHIHDWLVKSYASKLKFKDINEGLPLSMHPFVNGPLGSKMDHMKGPRKKEGRSRAADLVIKRTEAYWQS